MMSVLPQIVAEYLEVRDAENALKRRRDALRKQLLPMLEEAGGQYTDEDAAMRVYIEQQVRWEYDPKALYHLVDEHFITPNEYAECLATVVDKSVVQGWLDKGLITDRQLANANAKVGTKVVQQIQVAPVGKR